MEFEDHQMAWIDCQIEETYKMRKANGKKRICKG